MTFFLVLGTSVSPALDNTLPKDAKIQKRGIVQQYITSILKTPGTLSHHRLRVFGIGFVFWIGIINVSWDRILYESNDSIAGWCHGTTLLIANEEDMNEIGYCFFIKEILSFKGYTKRTLPYRFYLNNFSGYLTLFYYAVPHGPFGCGYKIIGKADDFQPYP